LDCLNFCRFSGYPLTTYDVAKVLHLWLPKDTFSSLCKEFMLSQKFKHKLQVVMVFFFKFVVYEDIIKKD
jgi:hypothetical protein